MIGKVIKKGCMGQWNWVPATPTVMSKDRDVYCRGNYVSVILAYHYQVHFTTVIPVYKVPNC